MPRFCHGATESRWAAARLTTRCGGGAALTTRAAGGGLGVAERAAAALAELAEEDTYADRRPAVREGHLCYPATRRWTARGRDSSLRRCPHGLVSGRLAFPAMAVAPGDRTTTLMPLRGVDPRRRRS